MPAVWPAAAPRRSSDVAARAGFQAGEGLEPVELGRVFDFGTERQQPACGDVPDSQQLAGIGGGEQSAIGRELNAHQLPASAEAADAEGADDSLGEFFGERFCGLGEGDAVGQGEQESEKGRWQFVLAHWHDMLLPESEVVLLRLRTEERNRNQVGVQGWTE